MCRLILAALSFSLLVPACSRPQTDGDPAPAGVAANAPQNGAASTPPTSADSNDDGNELVVGAPSTHENLIIFPVISAVARNTDRFITLEEGLASGTVQIREVGAARSTENVGDVTTLNREAVPVVGQIVNAPANQPQQVTGGIRQEVAAGNQGDVEGNVGQLMVVNGSDKPLYLMPGQIIVGGKQDRTIAKETFIAPGNEPVSLDVFCVEQGRWSSRDDAETEILLTAAAFDETQRRVVARKPTARHGEFVGSVGNLSKAARLRLQLRQDQSAVWDSVSQGNAASGAESETAAFTTNYVDADIIERFRPYMERLQQPIHGRERIVGVIVAVNGKVEAMDIFESTPLFRKLWPTLLKSYALDASNVAEKAPDGATCTIEQAREFLAKARTAQVDDSQRDGDVHLSKRSSEGIIGFQGGLGGGGFGGGGLGGAAHGAYFAK